jgi:hypothetical protein
VLSSESVGYSLWRKGVASARCIVTRWLGSVTGRPTSKWPNHGLKPFQTLNSWLKDAPERDSHWKKGVHLHITEAYNFVGRKSSDRTRGLDHDFSLWKSHIDKTALFSCCAVSAFSTRTIVMIQGSWSTRVLSGWRLAPVASYSGVSNNHYPYRCGEQVAAIEVWRTPDLCSIC